MNLISEKHSLSGHITVPGSKSHTIRALVLASLAEGTSVIKNPLASNDCKSAAKAIQKIGAKISGFPEESLDKELVMLTNAESALKDSAKVYQAFEKNWEILGMESKAQLYKEKSEIIRK